MIAIGNVDAAPAAQPPLVAVIEPLQPVQIVQIPGGRGMLTIDLERVQRLVPARVPRRLERRQRSVLEPGQKRTRIVDTDRFDLSSQRVLPLLDERLGHRGHLGRSARSATSRYRCNGRAGRRSRRCLRPRRQDATALRLPAGDRVRSSSPGGTWRGNEKCARVSLRR